MPDLRRLARAARRHVRRVRLGTTLAALAVAAACGDATGPGGGTLAGRWASDDGQGDGPTGASMTLLLEQVGGAVSGSGSYVLGGATVPLDVDGTVTDRVVVLTLTPAPAPGRPAELLLQAMLSDDGERLTAALTDGGTTATRVFTRP
jgi:hypothetical protein